MEENISMKEIGKKQKDIKQKPIKNKYNLMLPTLNTMRT